MKLFYKYLFVDGLIITVQAHPDDVSPLRYSLRAVCDCGLQPSHPLPAIQGTASKPLGTCKVRSNNFVHVVKNNLAEKVIKLQGFL